jgi:DNA-binding PadR family transcriptional regulator
MERELLKGHLDMLLLAIIARTPDHGYAIASRLHNQSDGQFDLAEGTLYPALHRLEANGWAVSNWQKADGRRRRVYQITETGQHMLAEQISIWDGLQTGIRLVLRGAI